jgi:hypothetical protein
MGNKNTIGRRSFLSAVGVGLGTAAVPTGLGSASTDGDATFRRMIEQSHDVKRRGGSVSDWHEHLADAGVAFGRRRLHTPVPAGVDRGSGDRAATAGPGGGYGPDEIDLMLTLSTASCTDLYYAELSWHYEPGRSGGWDNAGMAPPDAAAIAYENQWWRLADNSIDSATSTSSLVSYAKDSYTGNGPGFKIRDGEIYRGSSTHWSGVYLDPVGSYGPDERRVFGNYAHTWRGFSWDPSISVSVTAPYGPSAGLSLTGSWGVKKWKTNTARDGRTLLRLSQSDATDLGDCDGRGSMLEDPVFQADDTVTVHSRAPRRRHARVDEARSGWIEPGTRATVVGGPTTSAAGHVWWRVETGTDDGIDPAWVAQSYLELRERRRTTPAPRFDVDDRVKAASDGGTAIGVYETPDQMSSLAYPMNVGVVGYVKRVSEADPGDAYNWYWVAFNRHVPPEQGPGWVRERDLAAAPYDGPDDGERSPGEDGGAGEFRIGEEVRATTDLSVRTGPGLGNSRRAVLDEGETGFVKDGYVTTGEYTWWEVDYGVARGWSVERYLEPTS